MTTATTTVLEAAIALVVKTYKADRAGQFGNPIHSEMEAAVADAHKAGYSSRDIFGEADRRHGQWLIDNANQR